MVRLHGRWGPRLDRGRARPRGVRVVLADPIGSPVYPEGRPGRPGASRYGSRALGLRMGWRDERGPRPSLPAPAQSVGGQGQSQEGQTTPGRQRGDRALLSLKNRGRQGRVRHSQLTRTGTSSLQPSSPGTAGRRCPRGSPSGVAHCSVLHLLHVVRGISARSTGCPDRAALTNAFAPVGRGIVSPKLENAHLARFYNRSLFGVILDLWTMNSQREPWSC